MGLMLRRMCMMGASAIPTPPLIKTVSGALIHITDALAKPLKKLVVEFEPVQSGSGDPSPENERPITGWTGCNVFNTNENLLNLTRTLGTLSGGGQGYARDFDFGEYYVGLAANNFYTPSKITSYSVANNTVTVTCTDRLYGIAFPVSIKPSTTYYLSVVCSGLCNVGVGYHDKNGKYLSSLAPRSVPISFTTPNNASIATIIFTCDSTTVGTSLTFSNIQLSVGNSAPSVYSAYKGTTIPYTFPDAAGTVYGGTLTINEDGSGELVVDKQKLTGTSYTLATTRVDGYYARLNVSASYVNSSAYEDYVANMAKIGTFGTAYSITKTQIAPSGSTGSSMSWMHFYVPDTVVDYDPEGSLTLDQCMARDLPPANWEIIAPLPEPVTYQLTSQQVLTLLQGENNVWSDAQSIEITYVASANSDDLNAADSLNLLLGNAYTRGDVPDEEALQIIMGETR